MLGVVSGLYLSVNMFIAFWGTAGIILIIKKEGSVDTVSGIALFILTSLLVGEFVYLIAFIKRSHIRSLVPNILSIVLKTVWTGISLLLLYGLFVERGLAQSSHYPHFVGLMLLLLATNVPLGAIHMFLCFEKNRRSCEQIYQKMITK